MTGAPVLSLDRGNSTLDCLVHRGTGDRRLRLEPGEEPRLVELLDGARELRCIGVTVVPGGLAAAAALLAEHGHELVRVPEDVSCPLALDYETPETLGADRWLGCLAAYRLFGAAIVVDCGSATTVNRVDGDGTFRGGCIGPGLDSLRAAMAVRTPHLPTADAEAGAEFSLPARSTVHAVRAGLALGFCGMVERLVDALLEGMSEPPALVLTGGRAPVYERCGRRRFQLVPDLVHRGLRACLEPGPCSS